MPPSGHWNQFWTTQAETFTQVIKYKVKFTQYPGSVVPLAMFFTQFIHFPPNLSPNLLKIYNFSMQSKICPHYWFFHHGHYSCDKYKILRKKIENFVFPRYWSWVRRIEWGITSHEFQTYEIKTLLWRFEK